MSPRSAPARIQVNSSAPSYQYSSSPLKSLSQTIGKVEEKSEASKSSFPETSSKAVAYWLLGSAASVFGIVVFGGLTRLTESGLSITEWKPVTGSLPPLSEEDWQSEFDKYRASPEFKLLNPHMEVQEFKKIYYMEWGHRLWGRAVGLTFVLPAIYFVARRKVSANMSLRLLGIAGLIGFQGVIGWWMVKSGLKDDLFAPGSHPRVSQYRLTAHLGAAFLCYTAMLWNGLSLLREHRLLANPANSLESLKKLSRPELSIFRKSVAGLAVLVFITAMSGALVAGLDAGLIYNEFPYMGNGLAPPKNELWDKFYSRKDDGSDLWWRNMLENPSTVQLDHRILAMTTVTAVLSLWAYSRFSPRIVANLPRAGRKGAMGCVHVVLMQAVLGISTLIYMIPVPLAAAHQAGSLALLSMVLVLGNRVWIPKRSLRLVQKRLAQMGRGPVAGRPNVGPRSKLVDAE
ncbi:MAG: Cytochrome c oxidase assembly protein cox15 [Claussenomyces sp. TS43310]|nr:MAG: Cytochrome c oxidase assembly protein cox15 [Claussenomyces sp. TS43310]